MTDRGTTRRIFAARAAAARAKVEAARATRSGHNPERVPARPRQTRNSPIATPEARAIGIERSRAAPGTCPESPWRLISPTDRMASAIPETATTPGRSPALIATTTGMVIEQTAVTGATTLTRPTAKP